MGELGDLINILRWYGVGGSITTKSILAAELVPGTPTAGSGKW